MPERKTALRMIRVVHHVFAKIALPTVGARLGPLALHVAIPAAGDIFRRAGRYGVVGAAVGIIVVIAVISGASAVGPERP